MSIVHSFDFSDAAFECLAGTAAIAARLKQPLVVAYAVGPGIRSFGPELRTRIEDATRARLDGLVSELKGIYPGLKVAAVQVDAGDPVDELVEIASDHRAELLVVSSLGHPDLRRRMSSVSEKVAHRAKVPVLVMRDPRPWLDWAKGRRPLRAVLGISRDQSCLAAMELTARLRSAAPCDVIVTEVYSPREMTRRYGLLPSVDVSRPDDELQGLVERDLEKRTAGLLGAGELKIRPLPGTGQPADHLLDLAEREKASVVITGRHAPDGPFRSRWVTKTLLHQGRVSVLVVPDSLEHRPTPFPSCRRILAATDLTEAGDEAVRHAMALAAAARGELHLLHVAVTGEPGWEDEASFAARLRQIVPEDWAFPVSTHVVFGLETAASIATTAERIDADVICLAAHGALERFALGSVTREVLSKTPRPVLIVRRGPGAKRQSS